MSVFCPETFDCCLSRVDQNPWGILKGRLWVNEELLFKLCNRFQFYTSRNFVSEWRWKLLHLVCKKGVFTSCVTCFLAGLLCSNWLCQTEALDEARSVAFFSSLRGRLYFNKKNKINNRTVIYLFRHFLGGWGGSVEYAVLSWSCDQSGVQRLLVFPVALLAQQKLPSLIFRDVTLHRLQLWECWKLHFCLVGKKSLSKFLGGDLARLAQRSPACKSFIVLFLHRWTGKRLLSVSPGVRAVSHAPNINDQNMKQKRSSLP